MKKQSQSSKGSGVSRVSDLIHDRCPLGFRAKQSQFATAMPVGRSAFPGGRTCETKPICLRWTGKTIPKAFGLEAATHPGEQLRQTKPIRPRAGEVAMRAIVRNKANSADSQTKVNCRSGKRLRDRLLVLCLRKTKPISLKTDRAVARAICAEQSQFSPGRRGRPSPRPKALTLPPITRAIVRNKANSRHHADPEIGVPAGQACETKPVSDGRDAPVFHYSIIPAFQRRAGQRILIVAKARAAKAAAISQKRTTTWGSLQPARWKWWCSGAQRKRRLPCVYLK